jgi:Na+-transporting NADH:ubiquinone oxidoreductase subunit C
MKNGYVYTLVFMLILSVLFGGILASANAWLRPKIEQNDLISERRSVLYALGLDDSGSAEDISRRFSEQVSEETISDITVYIWHQDDGSAGGYAVPFTGAGLWGTIRGFLAVTPDLKTVLGLTFVEQNETPGLGGRIDEAAYKEQFRGVEIDIESGFAYGAAGGKLDAITGATSTSRAVLQILNNLLQETLMEWEVP